MARWLWYPDTCSCVLDVENGQRALKAPVRLCAYHAGRRSALADDALMFAELKRQHQDKNYGTAAVAKVLGVRPGSVGWRIDNAGRLTIQTGTATPPRRAAAQAAVDLAIGPGRAMVE